LEFKGQNHELLGKFMFEYDLGERRIGCINGDGPKSAVIRHTHFFDSYLYGLIEILDMDEYLSSSSKLIRSILRVGMRRT